MEEIETRTDNEKLARQRKLEAQEARKKEKEDALRAFQVCPPTRHAAVNETQEDRERQKKGIRK